MRTMAIGAIAFTPAASHNAAGPATVMSSQSTRQKPTAPAQKPTGTIGTDATSPEAQARETEQKMTDDERFSLIISLLGPVPSIVPRDPRIPEAVKNVSAGYTPGIPRLGKSATDLVLTADTTLTARTFGK